MAIDWGGFIQGVSDYGLERLKEERAKKMQEELLQLKDKYEQAAEERKAAAERRKVVGTRDAAGQPGMVEDVNMEGTVLNTRPLDEYSRQQREQATAKHEAEIKESESLIRHRTEQAANERARTAVMRESNSIAAQASKAGADAATRDPVEYHVQRLMNTLPLRDIDLATPESLNILGKLETTARQIVLSAIRSGDPASMDDMFSRAKATFSFNTPTAPPGKR